MYSLTVKDKGPDIGLMLTRALLSVSAVATFVYETDVPVFVNYAGTILLIGAAVFTRALTQKFRVHQLVLFVFAAIVLYIVTHSFAFALVLLFYASLLKLLDVFVFNKPPSVEINLTGIIINKHFAKPVYAWVCFSNVILKDNLLTLDFKDNKVLQLETDSNGVIDVQQFNDFCARQITA